MALFGDGTIALRALSTLFGVATIVLLYLAGRELDRARGAVSARFGIGTLAALLFALTPFQVYFSIEARPYALLCLGAALLTLGCLRILPATRAIPAGTPWKDRVPAGPWAMLLTGATLVVWTNNTAVLVLGAVSAAFVALWIFDRDSRATIVPIVAAGVLVALLWAPDWPLLIAQAREVSEDFWILPPTFEGVTFELHNLIGLDVLRATWWVGLAIAGGLVLIHRRIGWRWSLTIGSLALLPIVLNIGISLALKPILISRALIGAAPALALALAAAVVLIRPRELRRAALCALVIVHVLALYRFASADHVKEPWRPVVAALARVAPTGPILVVPNELALPLAHEAQQQRLRFDIRGLPADYPATGLPVRYPSGKCAPSVIDFDLAPIVSSLRRPVGRRAPHSTEQHL